MALRFPAAVKIDSTFLTDHGRAPVEVAREGRLVEVELANGDIKKYWKGSSRSTFTVNWEWIPSSAAGTVDGYAGRDDMKALLKDSQTTHTLLFADEDGGTESYTVWVEEYSETLKRRSDDDFFWDITVSFREQ